MYLKASSLKDSPSSSLFSTTLGKSCGLGTHAMTWIDGANFLKRRLKEAAIGRLLPSLLQGDRHQPCIWRMEECWRWHSVLPAMPTAGQQSYMTGVDRKPSGGYGTHSVLRYSVIPLAEHDIALLKEIEVGFHFPWRRYRSSSLC